MRQRGDILKASKRDIHAGKHFIIFYEGYDDINFIGAMVTHMESENNTPMEQSHFKKLDEFGNNYKFQFDNTQLVIAKLMKFESWGPFTKVGELSNEGIQLIERIIGHLPQEAWEDYLSRNQKNGSYVNARLKD